MAEAHAVDIRAMHVFADVVVSFLEEPPFLNDVVQGLDKQMVAVGLFVGGGAHAIDDMAEARNLASADLYADAGSVGDRPEFASLVVRAACSVS